MKMKFDFYSHIPAYRQKFVRHPWEAVGVGDIVGMKVLSLDLQRKRIGLTMRIWHKV